MVVLSAKLRRPAARGLRRARLLPAFEPGRARVVLVTGPAGAGKTTLLAQATETMPDPVIWLRPEATEASEECFVAHLARAGTRTLGLPAAADRSLDTLIEALDGCADGFPRIAVDDVHVLAGSPAEAALERLIRFAPPSVRFLLAGRGVPEIDLPGLRLADDVVELGPDALRFRTWEVERLLREVYGEPLPPADVALLTRRTGGWAAGLQLFHLATRGQPARQRREQLAELSGRSRAVRDYLLRHVLDSVPPRRREFLVGTSVMEVLTAELCDRLLDRDDSGRILVELEREQVFTTSPDDGRTFRYHPVLRSHLQTLLREGRGEHGAAEHYRRAADLLEEAGGYAEAAQARAHAEDWRGVTRLLHQHGAAVASGSAAWADLLPVGLREQDPWLLLAQARTAFAGGDVGTAGRLYRLVADRALDDGLRRRAAQEQVQVAALLPGARGSRSGWAPRLRAQLRRLEPDCDAPAGQPPEAVFLAGTNALLAGAAEAAAELAGLVLDDADSPPVLGLAARLLAHAAAWVAGRGTHPRRLDELALDAEAAEVPWLARAALTCALALRGQERELRAAVERCDDEGDRWGALGGWLLLAAVGTDVAEAVAEVTRRCEELDAAVVALWAEVIGVRRGADGPSPDEIRARSRQLGFPAGRVGVRGGVPGATSTFRIGTFGGLWVERDGRRLPLEQLRPKQRSLLRLLLVHGGGPLHRDRATDLLWPDMTSGAALHNLQVAISALRAFLDPAVAGRRDSVLTRVGEAYRLVLPVGSTVDLGEFDRSLATGRTGYRSPGVEDLEQALAHYTGELFPEEGAADWLVAERERRRLQAASLAVTLARVRLAAGAHEAAIRAASRAIELDPWGDDAWQLLVAAQEGAGASAAAERSRRHYGRVLAELGVEPLTPAPR